MKRLDGIPRPAQRLAPWSQESDRPGPWPEPPAASPQSRQSESNRVAVPSRPAATWSAETVLEKAWPGWPNSLAPVSQNVLP